MFAGQHPITSIFTWMGMEVSPGWSLWLLAWLCFAVCVVLAWRPWADVGRFNRLGAALFIGSLFACLAAFRWPIFCVPHELHPDESQMISGAVMLRHDPVFWRSVDGNTSGPLNHYALVLPTLLAGQKPYFAARVMGWLLAGAVMALSFLAARAVFPERVARIGILPLLAFFAFAIHPEHVHYSSEYVPIALLSLGIMGTVWFAAHGGTVWLWLSGFVLAAVPFAKLQAAPIAVSIFACAVVQVAFADSLRGKRTGAFVALTGGALIVPLTLALYASVFGLWRDIEISYLEANVSWVRTQHSSGWRMMCLMIGLVFSGTGTVLLLGAVLAPALLVGLAVRRASSIPAWYPILGAVTAAAGFASIVITSNNSPKYVLLMTPALGLLGPYVVARLDELRGSSPQSLWRAGWVVFLGLGVGVPALVRATVTGGTTPRYFNYMPDKEPATKAVVEELNHWLKPGDFLAVWGGPPEFYVRASCLQATRDGETSRQMLRRPETLYFRDRYLRDLQASRPRVFLDATRANRRGFEIELFPELADYVQRHYRLQTEIAGRRIYLRLDVAEGESR